MPPVRIPLLLTICVYALTISLATNAVGQSAASTWRLANSAEDLEAELALPPMIGAGKFDFSAELTLERIEGTAASVWLGKQLNFGLDGRGGTFFVEGPAIGRTKLLEPNRPWIAAGKPFVFRAARDDQGVSKFWINDHLVFQTKRLKGNLGQITLRPWRNRMTVTSATLEGALSEVREGVYLKSPIAPILADGSPQRMLDFKLITKSRRDIRSLRLSLDGTTDPQVVTQLTLHDAKSPGAAPLLHWSPKESPEVEWSYPMVAGSHSFYLSCQIKPGSDLHQRVRVTVESIHFEDGTQWKPAAPVSSIPVQRLAFNIHKKRQHNCHTFRIPAITRTPKGTLLAVYDMRYNSSRDLQEHIDIGLSRSTDGGRTWSEPRPIMDMGEYGGKPEKENGCSDPNILVDANTGEIFVSAVWTYGKPGTHQWSGRGSEPGFDIGTTAQFMVVRSQDDGQTWSAPENWTRRLKQKEWWLFAPAPGNGITLRDGTLVMPTQGRDENGFPFSNISFSRDHGKTWTVSSPARDNTTECSVAQLSDGQLMLNMRDNRNRNWKDERNGRGVATTADLGTTWTLHPSDHRALPEPVCMASLIGHDLADGRRVLLFSNPNDRYARRNMTVQLSLDDGRTWPTQNRVRLDENGGAYSSLVMIDDQTVGILYESSRADLVFQQIKLSELLD